MVNVSNRYISQCAIHPSYSVNFVKTTAFIISLQKFACVLYTSQPFLNHFVAEINFRPVTDNLHYLRHAWSA